jgi:hypothetical protein
MFDPNNITDDQMAAIEWAVKDLAKQVTPDLDWNVTHPTFDGWKLGNWFGSLKLWRHKLHP